MPRERLLNGPGLPGRGGPAADGSDDTRQEGMGKENSTDVRLDHGSTHLIPDAPMLAEGKAGRKDCSEADGTAPLLRGWRAL